VATLEEVTRVIGARHHMMRLAVSLSARDTTLSSSASNADRRWPRGSGLICFLHLHSIWGCRFYSISSPPRIDQIALQSVGHLKTCLVRAANGPSVAQLSINRVKGDLLSTAAFESRIERRQGCSRGLSKHQRLCGFKRGHDYCVE
jgi:hypothetical protein